MCTVKVITLYGHRVLANKSTEARLTEHSCAAGTMSNSSSSNECSELRMMHYRTLWTVEFRLYLLGILGLDMANSSHGLSTAVPGE